jgi:hypothetical protein
MLSLLKFTFLASLGMEKDRRKNSASINFLEHKFWEIIVLIKKNCEQHLLKEHFS